MASIRKRPDRAKPWQARYYDPSGRLRSRSFSRKTDAQRFLVNVEADMDRGEYRAPEAGRVTFREYAEGWRAAQMHRGTTVEKIEGLLRRHAYPTFGDRPIGSILPSEVQAWVKGLDLAPSTVAVVHGVVAGVFRAAVADRRIPASPCEGTKLPRVERAEVTPLPRETVDAIRAAMPAHLQAVVTLAACTGLRLGEALGLTVDRSGLRPPSPRPTLQVDRQLVVVNGEEPHLGPPKTSASRRSIPLPQTAVDALAAHLAEHPPAARSMVCRDGGREWREEVELVFTTARGQPVRRSHFSGHWRAAVREAGAPEGTRFHDLRHFYASLLIRYGESVKVVQSRLGHATAAETLDTYSHLWPDSEDRTRAAVDSVLGAGVAPAWPSESGR